MDFGDFLIFCEAGIASNVVRSFAMEKSVPSGVRKLPKVGAIIMAAAGDVTTQACSGDTSLAIEILSPGVMCRNDT